MTKKNILFLCTGNSCRSQMAEGWGKYLKGGEFNFYSAGTKKHGLNKRAVAAMLDVGIDISSHLSNTVDELGDVQMDYVFTVCSNAHETCPLFPGGKVIHVGFEDPPYLTKEMTNEDEINGVYREVRDQIKAFIQNMDSHINKEGKA